MKYSRDKRERKCFAELAKILRADHTVMLDESRVSDQLFRINWTYINNHVEVCADVTWYTGCCSCAYLPEESTRVRGGVYVAKKTWHATVAPPAGHVARTSTHGASITNLRWLGSALEVLQTLASDLGTPKYWPRLLAQTVACRGTTKGDMLMDMLTSPQPSL